MIAAAGKELRQDLSQSVLFAYGGNGSLFACGVAEIAGLYRVQLFSLGPVFSAFGSSVSDILHVYESSLAGVPVSAEGVARIRQLIEDLKAEGVKDLKGEGIKPENIKYAVEIEVSEKEGPSFAVPCSEESFTNEKSLQAALAGAAQLSGTNQGADLTLDLLRVSVKKTMPKPKLIERPLQGTDSAHAWKGTRQVLWGSTTGEAKIYDWDQLQPGNQLEGAAILEDANTTYFVPENWTLQMDKFGNAALTRQIKKS